MRCTATLTRSAGTMGKPVKYGHASNRSGLIGTIRLPPLATEQNPGADLVVVGWQQRNESFRPFTIISTGRSRPDFARAFNSHILSNCGLDEYLDLPEWQEARSN